MGQENNSSSGAPSSDTTSALFVSARKKQLEQQEAERIAKEKEEQRLAAEAEVYRLEQEVAFRRQRAEEEARRVEEAATRMRQAEEQARQVAQHANLRQSNQTFHDSSIASDFPRAQVLEQKVRGKTTSRMVILCAGAVFGVIVIVLLIIAFNHKKSTVEQTQYIAATPTKEPVEKSEYNITGVFFLDGNTDLDALYFYDESTVYYQDETYTFDIADDVISFPSCDILSNLTIKNEETLVDEKGNTFYKLMEIDEVMQDDLDEVNQDDLDEVMQDDLDEVNQDDLDEVNQDDLDEVNYDYLDDAPKGYSTFYDPTTGLKLYYPNSSEIVTGLTGDDMEIAAVSDGGYYFIAYNITDFYNQQTETDDIVLQALMSTFVESYFQDLYGSNKGIVKGSFFNKGADLSGEGSIALARMSYRVLSETQEVYMFGELTRVDKQNLMIFTMVLRQPDNEKQRELFNNIMKSMQYEAPGEAKG